jgi:hypothetical protein
MARWRPHEVIVLCCILAILVVRIEANDDTGRIAVSGTRILDKTGFHRDLITHLRLHHISVDKDSNCVVGLEELIPDGAFLDLDELSHRERHGGLVIQSSASFDVERLANNSLPPTPVFVWHPQVFDSR